MEVVEKKEMVHKDVYENCGEKEYASKGVAGTGLGLIYQVLIIDREEWQKCHSFSVYIQ